MERNRTTIHQLHPIEALLLVCLLSIEAIGRLINDPPRPFRRRVPLAEPLNQTLEAAAVRLGIPIEQLLQPWEPSPWSLGLVPVREDRHARFILEPVRETMEQICQPQATAEEINWHSSQQKLRAAQRELRRLQQRPPARGFAPDPEQP